MVPRRRFLFGAAALPVAGCDVPARLASLPERLRGTASFHGLPADTRVVLDGSDDDVLGRMSLTALHREIAYAGRHGIKELPEQREQYIPTRSQF